MGESLFSQSWYRVAGFQPSLRPHVQIHRHRFRGHVWYVLQDHSTGQFHRFSPEAYLLIAMMDGEKTLQDIWEAACGKLGDDMPTQDEVIGLLGQLHRAEVLQADTLPDITNMHERAQTTRRKKLWMQMKSPLGIRIPLFDPEKLLNKLLPLVRPIMGSIGVMVWVGAVLSALVLLGMHWSSLTENITDRVLSTENLLVLWLVYPVVKLVHEFGHAFAVKRWGGEVHEMGIMLLVFMPVPYVDASAASAFRDKYERMVVGAAGILVELFLAAAAMIVWVNVGPGTVRAVAFNVMLIAGISTLLFNGNPLLRFDAYYVLADYLELPNLGARANRYIGYLIKRYVLWLNELHSPSLSRRESLWLAGYAVASYCYRLVIMLGIALFMAGKFFLIGTLLAIWALYIGLVQPIFKLYTLVSNDPQLQNKRSLAFSAMGGFVTLTVVILLLLPLPSSTVTQGVIWAPEQSQIRAGAGGFVAEIVAVPGAYVKTNDALIVCHAPELLAEVNVLSAQLQEAQARYQLATVEDQSEADIMREEIRQLEETLAEKQQRQSELTVRSPVDGVFLVPNAADLPGQYVQRGSVIAYVTNFDDVRVRVVVSPADIDQVRNRTRDVEVRLSSAIGRILDAEVRQQVPAATRELPSPALGITGGGIVVMDPAAKDRPMAYKALFQLELSLAAAHVERLGERVFVRFAHEPEPLAYRAWRGLRRLFLSRLDV